MATNVIKETYPVTGMTCASCAASVESMLKSQEGVESAVVNFANSSVLISYDKEIANPLVLQSTVREIGYDLFIEETDNQAENIEKMST